MSTSPVSSRLSVSQGDAPPPPRPHITEEGQGAAAGAPAWSADSPLSDVLSPCWDQLRSHAPRADAPLPGEGRGAVGGGGAARQAEEHVAVRRPARDHASAARLPRVQQPHGAPQGQGGRVACLLCLIEYFRSECCQVNCSLVLFGVRAFGARLPCVQQPHGAPQGQGGQTPPVHLKQEFRVLHCCVECS